MIAEEHDLPTQAAGEESAQVKQARLWLHLDKVAHKIEESAKEFTEWVAKVRGETKLQVKPPIGTQNRCSDESTHTAQNGVTQVVRNFFGGGTRAQDTMLALSIIVNVLLSVLLYGAWKDLGTHIWLRSDALTKENAELRAEIKTTEALVQAYGIGKTVKQEK